MKVIKITAKSGVEGFVVADFDSGTSLEVPLDLYLELKLKKGTEITENDLKKIQCESLVQKLYLKLLDFVSYRQRSEKELKDKAKALLKGKFADGFEFCGITQTAIVSQAIKKIKDIGLVDDTEFAKSYITEKSSKYSKKEIEQKLKFKFGIGSDISGELMKGNEIAEILKVLRNKLPVYEKRYEAREAEQKMMAFLVRKGYNYGDIKSALALHKR